MENKMGNSTRNNEGFLTQKLKSALFIASPSEAERLRRREECRNEAIAEGVKAGVIASVAIFVPLRIACLKVPWFKANINYAGQTWITTAGACYRTVFKWDKTSEECNKKHQRLLASMKSV